MIPDGEHSLFLSHAGIDSEAALRLAQRLEESEEAKAHGLKVWIDKTDLGAGGRWKDALQSALAKSTAFAVYVGSHGVVNWVWDEVSVALDRAHKERDYPLVPVLAAGTTSADLPSFLSQYQGVGDPEQPDEFKKLLRAVLRLDPRAKLAIEREPFVGLQAYSSNKAHLFFGREKETDELVALLRETPLVLVTGNSGSGKSSLVLAGLVPAFRGGRLGRPREKGPDETIWHVIETRPGTDPFGGLADSVRDAAERTGTGAAKASDLADLVRTRQPDKVRDAVLSGAPKAPGRHSKVLVVVDQFEEFRNSPQAGAYVAALLRLATPGDDRIRVVLTMRRDYLYTCDSFPDLSERLQPGKPSGRYLLHRMSREGLQAVITKPLDLAGTDERDREDFARGVLKDVADEPGELGLLQMALWRTWSEAGGRGPDLVRAYSRIGRVEGALAQAADEVFNRLSPDEQRRAETLFVRLVRPGEAGGATRRVAGLKEFDVPTKALAEKLSQVEQWRLLTIQEDTVEIAHEQLATQWLRYQRWIANLPGDPERGIPADPRGDDLRLLQSLIADAARWEVAPAGEETARYDAKGVDLELYQQLAGRRATWLSDGERRFVATSIDADQKEKKRWKDERDERERLFFERTIRLLAIQARRAATEAYTPDVIERAAALALESIALARKSNRPIEADAVETARNTLIRLPFEVLHHGSPVQSLAVLRDGRLASGGQDGTIKLWPEDGVGEPVVFTHGAPVQSLAVLGDGRLASGGEDGTIKLWPSAGEPVVLTHDRGPHLSLTVLRDGRLASGGQDGTIKLWPEDGWCAHDSACASSRATRRSSTPARWVFAGVREPLVFTHGAPVRSLAALGDWRLASVGQDGTINIWFKDGLGKPVEFNHGIPVQSLAVLGDGRLASGGEDGTIKLWPYDRGGPVPVLNHGGWVHSLAVLRDGRLASGGQDGTIKLWRTDRAGAPEVLAHGSWVRSLAVLQDGRLASGGDDGRIKLWPSASEPVVLTHGRGPHLSLTVLRDGRLASGDFDGTIKLWPMVALGEPVVITYGSPVSSLAVLRDGRLASGHFDGRIKLWPADGVGKSVTRNHGAPVQSLAVLRDGQLASGGQDGTIKLWPIKGAVKPVVIKNVRMVLSLTVLRDGRLASGDFDGTIKLWPMVALGEPVVITHGSPVSSLAVLRDGRLASGGQDGMIKLWPPDCASEHAVLIHGAPVQSLAALGDGRLASGGQDGMIKLWPKNGSDELVVLTHGGSVTSLAVLEDGRLASGSSDGTIKLWLYALLEEERLISALCLRAGRNLSKEEWTRYIGPDTPWQPSCRDRPSNWRTPDP